MKSKYSLKGKQALYNLLMCICAVIFIFCTAKIVNNIIIKPAYNRKIMREASEIISKSKDFDNSDKIKEERTDISAALLEFQKINLDIISIISIPNTEINYPVVGASNNDLINYYLKHNYKKEASDHGSIIMDLSFDNGGLDAKNIIVYGHHMKDGSMFSQITKFGGDIDFYKKTPVINFDGYYWKIFAVNILNTETQHGKVFDYLIGKFNDNLDFLNYIQQVMTRSTINTPVKVNENDRILLLSTCSYEFRNFRTAVFARKLRISESKEVDTSTAIKNPNPLMPDIYYSRGQNKPPLLDFKTALENQSVPWYDGSLKTIKERT